MGEAYGLCAYSRWNDRNDTRVWKIQISSSGECFQANDSQEMGFQHGLQDNYLISKPHVEGEHFR